MHRKLILQRIFAHFQQMTQWVTYPNSYSQYHNKAEALIEALEVEDCGSVGGYDRENPNLVISKYGLYDRFLTLVRKYDTELKKETYFTIDSMAEYWKIMSEVRERFNK